MNVDIDAFPHGPMRRKDREITNREEIDAILEAGKVMYLALADGDAPFVVPVFYTYDGQSVYFHSAQAGTKIDILKRNNKACFVVSLDHGVIEDNVACDFEAKHRTVIGIGRASFVEETSKKTKVLDKIVSRFSEKKFEYPTKALDRTAVVCITIDSIKGKKHGFS